MNPVEPGQTGHGTVSLFIGNGTFGPAERGTRHPTMGPMQHYDRSGLEILAPEECLALLETATIGRIALTVDALPVVLPVNFVFSGGAIVISTAEGTKLHAAARRAVVAFEVDAIDTLYHTGWSVLVTGQSRQITDPAELDEARHLPLRAWGLKEDEEDVHYIKIEPTLVSGRRLPARHYEEVAGVGAGR